jgi:hypothetical protein
MMYQLFVLAVLLSIAAAVYYMYYYMGAMSDADKAKAAKKATGNESFCPLKM